MLNEVARFRRAELQPGLWQEPVLSEQHWVLSD